MKNMLEATAVPSVNLHLHENINALECSGAICNTNALGYLDT